MSTTSRRPDVPWPRILGGLDGRSETGSHSGMIPDRVRRMHPPFRRGARTPVRLAIVAALVVAAGACSSSGEASSVEGTAGAPPVLEVVATTTQVQDFSRVIGGDCVRVHGVLQPNVDPHDYEPSPADLQAIADADVI